MLLCDRAGALRRLTFWRRGALAGVTALLAATTVPGLGAATDLSSVPLPTYTVGSTVDIKPNILLVLDDSGSMDSDYLPDWAAVAPSNYDTSPATGNAGTDSSYSGTHSSNLPQYLYFNSAFNGVAYNAAVTYNPPITFTSAGAKDTSKYPSLTSSATSAWTSVPNDGYAVQDTAKSNLVDDRFAYFYTAIPGEYCDSPALTNCQTLSAASGNFAYPAPLRWCSDQQLTSCRGLQSSTYQYPRMPAPRIATLTISSTGSSSTITGITVDGKQIMSGTATTSSSSASTLATNVAIQINNCRYALPSTTNCTIVGYFAVSASSSNVVNIYAPGATSSTPTVSTGGTGTVNRTITSFAQASIPLPDYFNSGSSRSRSTNPVPGENLRTVLTSSITSYNYPGTSAKSPTRTDCAGTSCTYAEEMTNYANWWAYYRTRMQMMKTSTSRAFAALDSDTDITAGNTRYRVGFMSINNNTTKDFVNVTDFNGAQKFTWFSQFLKAKPNNNTPLRSALAQAGQLYGGKMNGTTFRGTVVTDPLQFSCQKNYTILSTDGYWNTNSSAPNNGVGSKLDGSTMVGNQDGTLARPYNDGATTQAQQRTAQLQQRTNTLSAQKGTLQKQTSQMQIATSQLQVQTAQPQQLVSSVQTSTAPLMKATAQLQQQTAQLMKQTSTLQQTTYQLQRSGSNVSSCNNNTGRCAYVVSSGPTNVSSCTPIAKSSGSGTWNTQNPVDCTYTAFSAATPAGSCTVTNQDTTSPYTVGTATQCSYSAWGTASTVGSCTTSAQTTATANGTVYNASPVQCTYSAFTAPTPTGSCTYQNPSTGPNFTVATATTCSYGTPTTPVNASSCTVSSQTTSTTNGTAYNASPVSCSYGSPGAATTVSSCTVSTPTTGSANGTVYKPTVVSCQYAAFSTFTNAPSCSTVAKATSTSNGAVWGQASNCQYTSFSGFTNASSCTAVAQSTGPNFTVGTAVNCQTAVTSAFANASSCTPTTTLNASGQTTQCQYSFATAATTLSCQPQYQAGDYTNAAVYNNCTPVLGNWTNVTACTASSTPDANGHTFDCQYLAYSGWSNVSSCAVVAQGTGPSYTGPAKDCQTIATGGTSDTLADVAAYYYNTDLRDPNQTGADATGTCTGPIIAPSTTANDLCANNVPAYGQDKIATQHMTTHTLGLGATGMMVFSPYQNDLSGNRVNVPDYTQQPSGDFYDVAHGTAPSPSTGICPWQASGNCTWPTPASDSPANIDDLWHAAVNGHGTYFSARDPSAVTDALTNVLGQITNTPRPGTAAAAASSNPNITSSDNYVFSSSYQSVDWFGELIMQQFNTDGTLTPQQWSAMRQLDCAKTPWAAAHNYVVGDVYNQNGSCYLVLQAYASGSSYSASAETPFTATIGTPVTRTIYTVGSSGLTPFTWSGLSSAQQAYFSMPWIGGSTSTGQSPTGALSQFCSVGTSCMSAGSQTAAAGQALVNFLAGDRTNESTFFRSRLHILGDIVSSEASYVKLPLQNYSDAGYSAFVTLMANRLPTVYVGSNDGMLHAFDALTGNERWAFIPSAVLPDLYHLADTNYSNQHRYFVDGTPQEGDICPKAPSQACAGTDWKSILVGGLNQGGKSFYALDVTDPSNPKFMWEFTNANMGYTYSNPRITKLANGTWVVIVASGYNNADGLGHLFVINASTGALITDLPDTAGSSTNPSGLARIAARAPLAATDNTVEEVYGGDLLGNVWRFDVNGTIGSPGIDAQLLVNLKDPSGNPQPITAKPTVAVTPNTTDTPLVMVGTGRYLGVSDLTDTNTYSMYAIKDTLGTATLTTPRASGSKFVQQTMTVGTCPANAPSTTCTQGQTVRTATSNPVDWSVNNGWYLDFPVGGERSETDATLALGTLVFTTVKPQSATASQIQGCNGDDTSINAKSFLYYLDYTSGGAVSGTSNVVGEELCTCIATRPSVVKTVSGNVEGIIRTSGGSSSPTSGGSTAVGGSTDMGYTQRQDLPYNNSGGAARRISWRELNGQ